MTASHRRKINEQTYNQLYTKLTPKLVRNQYVCFYCGEMADTTEHFPPISSAAYVLSRNKNAPLVKFPSCAQCNGIGGHYLDNSIIDRKARIQKRIMVKNKGYISCFNQTTAEEYEELKKGDTWGDKIVVEGYNQGLLARNRASFGGYEFEDFDIFEDLMNYKIKVFDREYSDSVEAIIAEAEILRYPFDKLEALVNKYYGNIEQAVDHVKDERHAASRKEVISKQSRFIERMYQGMTYKQIWSHLSKLVPSDTVPDPVMLDRILVSMVETGKIKLKR